jgi:transcriptional regulator with XRE-family HTH domain
MKLTLKRKAARLTQQQLADKCGISRVTLARIETNACKPSLGTLCALSAALGCTVDDLLDKQDAS